LPLRARLEVAVLVEDVVGGQQRLRDGVHDVAVFEEDGPVVEPLAAAVLVPYRRADDEPQPPRRVRGDVVERLPRILDERGLVEEVLRRVADEAELGEDGERGARAGRAPGVVEDALGVPGEVADGGVDLAEGDLHGARGRRGTRTRGPADPIPGRRTYLRRLTTSAPPRYRETDFRPGEALRRVAVGHRRGAALRPRGRLRRRGRKRREGPRARAARRRGAPRLRRGELDRARGHPRGHLRARRRHGQPGLRVHRRARPPQEPAGRAGPRLLVLPPRAGLRRGALQRAALPLPQGTAGAGLRSNLRHLRRAWRAMRTPR